MAYMSGNRAFWLAKQYIDEVAAKVARDGFQVQIEEDRSILEGEGQEKIFYFIPKDTAKPQDGYDEYIYAEGAWEQVGVTDVDLSEVEMTTNKVTSISAESTDDEYPSAKCVYELVGDVEAELEALL
jgi:hypothetical protein